MANIKFNPDVIEDIKTRISILDVVRPSVSSIKKKGQGWWACCPFHNEKTPSFQVRPDQGFYHCFGCGAHGDIFTFVEETRGGGFAEAVEYLADKAGIKLEHEELSPQEQKRRTDGYQALERASTFFSRNLGGDIKDYLTNRGLTEDTIEHFKLGWAEDEWTLLLDQLKSEGFDEDTIIAAGLAIKAEDKDRVYDRFRGRVMFPILDLNHRPIAFGGRIVGDGEPKYLNSPDTPFFNKSHTLYNLNNARHSIKDTKTLLLAEGYMDVIALWQAGIQNAVAPLGTAVTEDQIRLMWRFVDTPICCLDGDSAGKAAAIRLAKRILPVLIPTKTLHFVWLPEGEDPDSLIQSQGKEAFEELLNKPATLEDVLWQSLVEEHSPKTAEGRSAIANEIDTLTGQIKDKNTAQQYRWSLRNRLFDSQKTKKGKISAQKRGAKKIPSITSGGLERTLLAILFRKPDLLKKYEEKFLDISFENQGDKMLSQLLYRALTKNTLEKESLNSYLENAGALEEVENLTNLDTIRHLADEDLETFWLSRFNEVWAKQRLKRLKEAFERDPSPENWEAYKSFQSVESERQQ